MYADQHICADAVGDFVIQWYISWWEISVSVAMDDGEATSSAFCPLIVLLAMRDHRLVYYGTLIGPYADLDFRLQLL